MAEPRQPDTGKGSKAGQVPGDVAPPPADKRETNARPVDEEDVFGGAERTQNDDVKSKNAKP
jgi:hypothetical protein